MEVLRFGESFLDSFPFTVTDGFGGTVSGTAEVEVYGTLASGDDLYEVLSTDFLSIDAPGVLANDPGENLKIVGFEVATELGGFLNMTSAGSLEYDPTEIFADDLATAFADSPVEGFAMDRFTYFYTSGDDPTEFEGTVTLLIAESQEALDLGPEFDFLVVEQRVAARKSASPRTGNFTHEQLGMDGKMSFGMDSDLSTATIEGPSGYGFTLSGDKGSWKSTFTGCNAGGCSATYEAIKPVKLSTGFGDVLIPITKDATISFDASNNRRNEVTIDAFNLKAFGFDTGSGSLKDMKDQFGIDLNAIGLGSSGSGTTWGLALGKDLKSTLNPAPPVMDAIPYFYFQATVGQNLLTLGDKSVSQSSGADFTVVFDPADPMLFVKGSFAGGGAFFGVGGSKNGQIPWAIPESETPLGHRNAVRTNANNADKRELFFNAHAWIEGKITLGSFPISVEGNVAINLDGNGDGTLAGGLGDKLDDLFEGKQSVEQVLGDTFSDLQIGLTGKVNLEADFAKGFLGATIPIGKGAALWSSNIFSFRGGTVNPFADTPLSFYEAPTVTVDGFVGADNGDFQFKANMETAKIFGFELSGGSGELLINPNQVTIGGTMVTPMADISLSGSYYLQNTPREIGTRPDGTKIFETMSKDSFLVEGKITKEFNFGPFEAGMGIGGWIRGGKDLQGDAFVKAGGWIGADAGFYIGSCFTGVRLRGRAEFSITSSGLDVSGSGSVSAVVCTPVTVGFSFDSDGFSIMPPDPIPNISITF